LRIHGLALRIHSIVPSIIGPLTVDDELSMTHVGRRAKRRVNK